MNPREEDSDSDSGASTCQIPAVAPPTLEELNLLIPAYEFLEFVDHGGMGVVYKALQKSLNRIVAIKTLPPANQNRRTFADRFKREAEALASLNHPNIVAVYDSGVTTSGFLYYVMEFVKGSNLRRKMKSGALSTRQMLAIVTQVSGALQYAHDHGVVHRDIKPGNILLDEDGNAKVADFGLAKVLGLQHAAEGLTSPFDSLGTPDYSAPEVLTGDTEVDHRADIYSLGVMLYEMSTGHVPRGAWEPPSRCGADFRLDEMVTRALQVDPQQRYQSVNDLTQGLREMLKQSDVTPDRVRAGPKATAALMTTPLEGSRGPALRRMSVVLLVSAGLGGVGIVLWETPATREWLGINNKSPTMAASKKSPSKTPEAMMRDQVALAKWVFEHGGLINVVTASHKQQGLSDDEGLRSYDSLPKEEFTILRVSFCENLDFTDKDLVGLLSLAEKAQSVTHLSLRGTSVSSLGLAHLPLLKSTLKNLNIRHTSAFSAQSLPSIAACDRLKMLFITIDAAEPKRANTASGMELVAQLQSLRPDCEIKTDLSISY